MKLTRVLPPPLALAVLVLAASASGEEPGSWVETHAHAIRRATGEVSSEALTDALDKASEVLRTHRGEMRKARALDPLVAALAEIPTDAPLPARAAMWRTAALCCHPGGVSLLVRAADTMGGDDLGAVRSLSEATRGSRCGLVHAWFITEAPRFWEILAAGGAGEDEPAIQALRTAIGTVTPGADVVDPRRGAKAVGAALKRTLKMAKGPLHHLLLVTLAETPGGPTRSLLKKWMASKNASQATLVAVLEALGRAGDDEAVPLLLGQLADTAPPVLEAVLVGLFALPEDVLKDGGRKILSQLFKAFDEEGRESGSLANNAKRTAKQETRLHALEARRAAWQTRRILDDPPMELPEGATGVAGVNALIWRILDAGPKGIKPPTPPKDAWPAYLNGRPYLPGRHWSLWWKNAR